MNAFLEQSILGKYLNIVVTNYLKGTPKVDSFHFRCNICNDSKISKVKKRGWLKKNREGIWGFHCYNCGKSMKAIWWLKIYFPSFYDAFYQEVYFQSAQLKPEEQPEPIVEKEVKFDSKKAFSLSQAKWFVSLKNSDSLLAKNAIRLCQKRLIPESVYLKWYICEQGFYANRLVIPFYNSKGKIYFWQGRDLVGEEPKYLNYMSDAGKEDVVYGIDFIDKTKEVIVQEGPIDSEFVENSVATMGLSWSKKTDDLFNSWKTYYLFDYDNSKDTKKKCLDMLSKGKSIFLWRKFMKDKGLPSRKKWDINEYIMWRKDNTKLKFEELKPYFSNNFFDGVYLT